MVSTVREVWKILFGATTAFGVSSGMLGGSGVWPLLLACCGGELVGRG